MLYQCQETARFVMVNELPANLLSLTTRVLIIAMHQDFPKVFYLLKHSQNLKTNTFDVLTTELLCNIS